MPDLDFAALQQRHNPQADPNFRLDTFLLTEINRLCDLKQEHALNSQQFFGAVEVVLGRRPYNEVLGDLVRKVANGDLPTSSLIAYLDEERQAAAVIPDRPRTSCGCGYELVWCGDHWEHDAAPFLWGDDHSPDAPEPTGPARWFWDQEDGQDEPIEPLDVLDYCNNGCNNAVTIWDAEVCTCCHRVWGEGELGSCRNFHVTGQVWLDLLNEEK